MQERFAPASLSTTNCRTRVAMSWWKTGIGMDLRQSYCELFNERFGEGVLAFGFAIGTVI